MYLAGTSKDGDTSCRVCSDKENITHLVRCKKLLEGFWNPMANVMENMGMTVPQGSVA